MPRMSLAAYVNDAVEYITSFSLQSTSIALIIAALITIRLSASASIQAFFNRCFSACINKLLCWYYPIRNLEDGTEIPTCPYVWPNGQGNVAKFLEGLESRDAWSSKYGQVYRIWSALTSTSVVSRPEHVRTVFQDSDNHSKAPNNNSGYYLGQLLGECLGLISGTRWKTLKDGVATPFLHVRMKDHIDIVLKRTEAFLNDSNMARKLEKGLVDPVEDFKMLPFWIVSEILFGPLDSDQEEELERLALVRERLFKHAIAGGLTRFSIFRFLPLQSLRELHQFKRDWAAFNHQARENLLRTRRRGAVVQMWEEVEQSQFSAEELLQTLDEMLFANLDVTMGSMSWNLVLLAENADTQEKLRSELTESAGAASVDDPQYGSFLLSSTSFLAACILEAARLQPLAAFSVPQSAPSERILDGYLVPAGTCYIIDTYALNVKNEIWSEDASVYRPERFVGQSNSSIRYNYWRFGFGPRQCLGKYVADLIVRCLISQLVSRWELSVPKGQDEWKRVKGTWINHPEGKLQVKKRS